MIFFLSLLFLIDDAPNVLYPLIKFCAYNDAAISKLYYSLYTIDYGTTTDLILIDTDQLWPPSSLCHWRC